MSTLNVSQRSNSQISHPQSPMYARRCFMTLLLRPQASRQSAVGRHHFLPFLSFSPYPNPPYFDPCHEAPHDPISANRLRPDADARRLVASCLLQPITTPILTSESYLHLSSDFRIAYNLQMFADDQLSASPMKQETTNHSRSTDSGPSHPNPNPNLNPHRRESAMMTIDVFNAQTSCKIKSGTLTSCSRSSASRLTVYFKLLGIPVWNLQTSPLTDGQPPPTEQETPTTQPRPKFQPHQEHGARTHSSELEPAKACFAMITIDRSESRSSESSSFLTTSLVPILAPWALNLARIPHPQTSLGLIMIAIAIAMMIEPPPTHYYHLHLPRRISNLLRDA
ncbi:hypothetical protein EIP91_005382 [Steccherinum ochraceum]|uniref:Uncharacterized protein n=1 Tax=Steccherinum ochraceum TaxID=92696 RepID=A0A4R0RA19_9APHY|nr:hypothetical protein EIP91_005382 [Steccherinum ochraceum]